MYESMNEAGDAILSSFFLSLTTNLFESELPNRVGEATGYNHRVGEWQTQANNNNGMIGAKCKGSHPTLPFHHTTVVLRCSYPAAVHRPSTGVYIYLGGHHWTWGYNHSSVLVFKVRMLVHITLQMVSGVSF